LPDITVTGDSLERHIITDIKKPDTSFGSKFRLLKPFLRTRPHITADCTGCGVCVENCPRKIMSVRVKKKSRKAVITIRSASNATAVRNYAQFTLSARKNRFYSVS
jgi:ferredoxin